MTMITMDFFGGYLYSQVVKTPHEIPSTLAILAQAPGRVFTPTTASDLR